MPRQCLYIDNFYIFQYDFQYDFYIDRNVQPSCQIWDIPFSDHNGVLVDLENVTNKIRTDVKFFLGIVTLKILYPKINLMKQVWLKLHMIGKPYASV